VVINPYLRPPGRDTFPNSVEVADALSLARQSRVMGWITSEESSLTDKQLVAQNYCNFYSSARELLPGVSIINFHYAYPEGARSNDGLGTALSYDETGFLGHADAAYLRQAWNFMLSGGSVFAIFPQVTTQQSGSMCPLGKRQNERDFSTATGENTWKARHSNKESRCV
jgi:hypothetical protein